MGSTDWTFILLVSIGCATYLLNKLIDKRG